MSDFFKTVVDPDGGFLRVELPVDITDEKGAFAHSGSTDNDGFVVFETCFLELAH